MRTLLSAALAAATMLVTGYPGSARAQDAVAEAIVLPDQGPERTALLEIAGVLQVVTYVVVDGQAIAGGDMDLGTAEEVEADNIGNLVSMLRTVDRSRVKDPDLQRFLDDAEILQSQGKAASPVGTTFWPDRNIPFRIDASITDPVLLAAIATAIDKWNAEPVPVKLVPAPAGATRVLNFVDAPGTGFHCVARVGFSSSSGGLIKLNAPCLEGNIRHEILHAVGIMHEHQRQDRSPFLQVAAGLGTGANFGTQSAVVHTTYDLCSMSHYPPGVQLGGAPTTWFTLTTAGRAAFDACKAALPASCRAVGQRCRLSAGDLAALRALYD